jgi:Flp pilus assembly protein TadD
MAHHTKGGAKQRPNAVPEAEPSRAKSVPPGNTSGGGRGRTFLLCLGLTLAVLAAYANHFRNEFHFDDFHTIVNNLYVTDLHNVPRFFGDAALFSTMAVNATYRPVTSTSLTIDYWLGHGYQPFFFHLSTFCWFAVQLILMFFLFRRIMDRSDPHPSNTWTALAAAACYGLHPANAETVNYIIQRGDLYNTLGAVASLLWFAAYPAQRKYGWYLLPAVAACLAKPPALIYPFLLLAYVFLMEQDGAFSAPNAQNRKAWSAAIRAALPALLVTAAVAVLIAKMTPATFQPGGDPLLYRLTQPWVALHYFQTFFLPTALSADTDWTYVSGPFSGEALAGYLFAIVLLAVVFHTSRSRQTRPIAFGLVWFVVTLLPTSLMPLADVTNDHRMFFPFVGLALSVFWSLRLMLFRKTARLTANPLWMRGAIAALAVVLCAEAAGTHMRNDVWHTEESLWHDVTVKSPNNGRGWSSYGASFVTKQDFAKALPPLERAAQLRPYDSVVQLNLGVSYGGLGRDEDAERHFRQALAVAPGMPDPPLYYARWLESKHRLADAQAQAEAAVQANPRAFFARYLLLKIYSQQRNRPAFDNLMQDSLRLAYNDETARRYLEERANAEKREAAAPAPPPNPAAPQGPTPEALLNISAKYCNEGDYQRCIAMAKKALELRPGYAEAYNNMAAGYSSLEQWDEAIKAASEAIRLKPDYPMARKNLDWAVSHKQAQKGGR